MEKVYQLINRIWGNNCITAVTGLISQNYQHNRCIAFYESELFICWFIMSQYATRIWCIKESIRSSSCRKIVTITSKTVNATLDRIKEGTWYTQIFWIWENGNNHSFFLFKKSKFLFYIKFSLGSWEVILDIWKGLLGARACLNSDVLKWFVAAHLR